MSFSVSGRKVLLVPQTVVGTIPNSPTFWNLDAHTDSELTSENEWQQSRAPRANRTMGKGRKNQKSGSFTIGTDFKRDAHIEYLLKAVHGADWVETGVAGVEGDVLKSGMIDYWSTIEMQEVDNALIHYFRQQDCNFTGYSIQHEAGSTDGIKAVFKGQSIASQVRSLSALPGASAPATPAADRLPYSPEELTLTLDGTTLDVAAFNISYEQTATKEWKYGSASARGLAMGQKVFTFDFTCFRPATLALDTMADSDAAVPLQMVYGSTALQKLTLNAPAVQFTKRTVNVTSGESRLIQIVGQASFDTTAATDVSWTRS